MYGITPLQYLSRTFTCTSKLILPFIMKGIVKVTFPSPLQYLKGPLLKSLRSLKVQFRQYPATFILFNIGGELAQWYSTQPLIQRSPVRVRVRSHTGVMNYDEACFMHLTPGVVHNFPKAVSVYYFWPLCTKRSQVPIRKEKATPGILVSRLNNRW